MEGVIQSGRVKVVQGRLRHKVQIVQPTLTQGSSGGWDISDDNVLLVTYASIEALSAAEKFAAHEFPSEVTHKVIIRHPRSAIPQGVTANMQVWFNTRQFQIEGVLNPDERQDMLVLMCMEIDDSVNQLSASAPEGDVPAGPPNPGYYPGPPPGPSPYPNPPGGGTYVYFDSGLVAVGTDSTAIVATDTKVLKIIVSNVGVSDTTLSVLDGNGAAHVSNSYVAAGGTNVLDLGGADFPLGVYAQAENAGLLKIQVLGWTLVGG